MTITLREMAPADEEFVLSVRNDAAVRAASRTDTVKDSYWFSARLGDAMHKAYVVLADGQPAGIASLQLMSAITAELNLALAPEFRGKGLSPKVIEELVHRGYHYGIQRFLATVQGTNISSLRAFLHEGFLPTKWVYLERRK